MKVEAYSPTIRRKEMDAVLTAMVEDKIGPGDRKDHLVQTAKEYLQFDFSLALRSPAIALFYALKALGLEAGSGVVVSALSPRYYALVLQSLGLKALYADVDEATANMSADTIRALLHPSPEAGETGDAKARAIVVHHTLGFVPDVPGMLEIGLPAIEDCSLSFGTNWAARKAGSFGTFTLLGLEERDILTGGGGALLYASSRREASVLRGYADLPKELCLADLNAAMATVQFKESERNFVRRREIAQVYLQSAQRTRHKRFVQTGEAEYNNYAFPLLLETGMKDVKAYASRKEVVVEHAFDDTLATAGLVDGPGCPVAASLALRTALFPLYPRLSSSQAAKVAKVIATLP